MALLLYLVLVFLLSVMAVFFCLKWLNEKKQYDQVRKQAELLDVLVSASLGGYYFWRHRDGLEYFSSNLIKMLQLHRDIKTFDHFMHGLGPDRSMVISAVDSLKMAEKSNFILNMKTMLSGQECYLQCVGHRIDDENGAMVGVVVWFLDVTEYMERLKQVSSENVHVKHQVRNFVSLLNALPFPVWQRDTQQFNIHYYNTMYGKLTDSEYVYQSDAQEVVPQLYSEMKTLAMEAYKKGRPVLTFRHLVHEGERKLFLISEQILDNGKSMVGVAHDITRQEEVEQELARHVSAHADLLESSSSAMAVYGRDTTLQFFNQAFVRFGQFDEAWLSSNPSYTEVLEVMREKNILPEQADFRKFRDQQLKLFEDVLKTHEEFFYLSDGRTMRVIVIPHALGGLLFAYEDVSDRLAMERSYNTLIAVQKVTIDHVNEGIAVYGEDGALKLYNPHYAALWPDEKALLGKKTHLTDMLEASRSCYKHEESWESFKRNMVADLTSRSPVMRRLERTDGKVLHRTTIPLPDGNTLISFVDMTDSVLLERSLRERNDALEQADRIKTEFLANVSYELRTPLTSIMGFTELLLHTVKGTFTKYHKEQLKHVYDSSVHLMLLIDDILDLASMDAGYITLHVKAFNLQTLLTFVVNMFREKTRQHHIAIEMACDKALGDIEADERRIQQVLFNLMNNAIRFTPERGKITLGARKHDGVVELWVQDTGIGIPKEDIDKVWNRFYRGKVTEQSSKGKTGLGLPVVKNIVELHGGEVSIVSQEGKGTCVTVTLPLGKKLAIPSPKA